VVIEVKLKIPSDSTILNELIYEGLLYLIGNGFSESVCLDSIELSDDAFAGAFRKLDMGKIDSISVVMSGNDNLNSKLLELLKIRGPCKRSFREILKILQNQSKAIDGCRTSVEIAFHEKRGKIYLGNGSEPDGLTAQIFKVDRYTGYSSLESPYTSRQVTLYFSKEIALILLLGIYASFTTAVRVDRSVSYYFLLFSADEVQAIFNEKSMVRKYLDTRAVIEAHLSSVLRTRVNELLPIILSTNVTVISQLRTENLDKLSVSLLKIDQEGQTYKIYENIPLTAYSQPVFIKILEKFGKNPDFAIGRLSDALSSDSVLFHALTWRGRPDRGNVLRAIMGLHRFVANSDAQGWFTFARELSNASIKCESESDRKQYSYIISGLA
jgi:hypothetical protein